MPSLILSLLALAFAVAIPATALARALGHKLNALDGPGVPGQIKAETRKVPNTGGIGIYLGIALPIALGLIIANTPLASAITNLFPALADHLPGIARESADALTFLAVLTFLHILGLVDDRKPLGPLLKLVLMLAASSALVILTRSRLLTFLDPYVGGPWLSILITVLWLGLVTNALNFMDNMDGLAAGVGVIASSCFLAATLIHGQWFVSAMLALLVGSLLGFLVFNFPRHANGGATIFMGDGGALVLGATLGFLTVRTTYYAEAPTFTPGAWYGVLMPLIVLAVPLYDFASVTIIRLRQGKSPFVGDLQHLSHRLTRRGLSRRDAVLVIYGLTGITALGGVALASLAPYQAALVGAQTALVLLVVALYEGRANSPGTPHKP